MRIGLSVVLCLVAALAGMAQDVATNVPGARSFAAPPAGFDVLTASEERLAEQGFPPRPDPGSFPKEYASWSKAMRASRRRIVPALAPTNLFHGPARLLQTGDSIGDNVLLSSNWSGFVDLNGATRFGASSFSAIATEVVVPTAQEAFGVCSGDVEYGSSWVGMDGANSQDVLQAGIEFDAACFDGATATLYAPWFEWYPFPEIRITNLPIAPGDDVYVEVWNTSATQGYAYVVNENANETATISFVPPAGTKLVGNSAEWITERPETNGTPATLTNYIADPFWSSFAATHNNRGLDPGSSEAVVMLDDDGDEISYPTLLGDSAFVMQDTGSAR